MKIYTVYYMDNDRRQIIIADNLTYLQAVKLCQQSYNNGLSCNYSVNY